MNIWILKCQAVEITLYRMVGVCKDCSSFPVKTNNEQLVVVDCCRMELLLFPVQDMNFKQK